MKIRILLVDDESVFAEAVRLALRGQPVEVVWVPDGTQAIQLYKLDPYAFAVVILDYKMPGLNGAEVCAHLRRINPEQEFLFTSGERGSDILIELLETGSNGFISKGTTSPSLMRDRITRSVQRYQNERRLLANEDQSPWEIERRLRAANFIGRSQALLNVCQKAENYRGSPYPTLIVGESGAGKELVARALVPKDQRLVPISGASYRAGNENLLEADLFGYVKGAFTGADKDKPGLLTQAAGAVFFIDELHHLGLAAQAKLLRFLEEMKFRRVGDHTGREISVQFKLICATHPDIHERVKDGRFLPDLIRRVGELVIQVPPLRERPEDIEPLVRYFQDDFNKGKPIADQKQFRISTVHEMSRHGWAGNVRDLKSAVRRMLTDASISIIEVQDFKHYLDNDFLEKHASGSSREVSQDASALDGAKGAKSALESKLIKDALRLSRTRSEASKRLGYSLPTFTRRLKELEINPELFLKEKVQAQPTEENV